MRLLLLGGTSEARQLAAELLDIGVDVTSSLAWRVARPRLPVGKVASVASEAWKDSGLR